MAIDKDQCREHGEKLATHEAEIKTLYHWKDQVNGSIDKNTRLTEGLVRDMEWLKKIIWRFVLGSIGALGITGICAVVIAIIDVIKAMKGL